MTNNIVVNKQQLSLMRHALGLQYEKKPYRNRFMTPKDGEDGQHWEDLVSKGLAGKRKYPLSKDTMYWVTEAGAEFLNVQLPKD